MNNLKILFIFFIFMTLMSCQRPLDEYPDFKSFYVEVDGTRYSLSTQGASYNTVFDPEIGEQDTYFYYFLNLPYGTPDILAPVFETFGSSVTVGGIVQTSGVSTQNLSAGVEYVIHFDNGRSSKCTVQRTKPLLDSSNLGYSDWGGTPNRYHLDYYNKHFWANTSATFSNSSMHFNTMQVSVNAEYFSNELPDVIFATLYSNYPGAPFWSGTLQKIGASNPGDVPYSLQIIDTSIPTGAPIILHLEIPQRFTYFYISSIEFSYY